MQLTYLDWTWIALYFVINAAIGFYYKARAGKNVSEFFLSGRNVPWWLAGTSMVATTFAADTPLAVTGMVARGGIAGNWLWWNFVASGMMTVFFYARLWRRSGVMTDIEFTEIRYAGKPAAFLRGLPRPLSRHPHQLHHPRLGQPRHGQDPDAGAGRHAHRSPRHRHRPDRGHVFHLDPLRTLGRPGHRPLSVRGQNDHGHHPRLRGRRGLGGMAALKVKLENLDALHGVAPGGSGSVLSFIPDFHSPWMPMMTFFVYIGMNWWATWYPGAEPGGGGYIAQRMLCAKDEKNSLLATLWFNIAHFAIRPWPWIITALASLVLFPGLADTETGYIRVMIAYLPASLRGVMLAAFAAAYMSTIATQLNWGASYIVNDFYRRFIRPVADERHYVHVSQWATVLLTVVSAVVTFYLTSIAGAWKWLLVIGRGHGSGVDAALVLVANYRHQRDLGDDFRVDHLGDPANRRGSR